MSLRAKFDGGFLMLANWEGHPNQLQGLEHVKGTQEAWVQ